MELIVSSPCSQKPAQGRCVTYCNTSFLTVRGSYPTAQPKLAYSPYSQLCSARMPTRLRARQPRIRGSISGSSKRYFSVRQRLDRVWGPPSFPSSGCQGLSPGANLPEDHSPSANAEVKNAWSCISTPPCILMEWYLIKFRDNRLLRTCPALVTKDALNMGPTEQVNAAVTL
jgi:hypothetical protein